LKGDGGGGEGGGGANGAITLRNSTAVLSGNQAAIVIRHRDEQHAQVLKLLLLGLSQT